MYSGHQKSEDCFGVKRGRRNLLPKNHTYSRKHEFVKLVLTGAKRTPEILEKILKKCRKGANFMHFSRNQELKLNIVGQLKDAKLRTLFTYCVQI